MEKQQRLKYEMFTRVQNFGVTNQDVFPEAGSAGKTFAELAEVVTAIEQQLVRRAQARTDARKVKITMRRAVRDQLKAIAATGRQVTAGESVPHPFRMPRRHAATAVLTTARLFLEEAERRRETFVELGMAPTFLADFRAVVADLEGAIGVQQNSRAARKKAQAAIEVALARGAKLVDRLDVTVANMLRADPARLSEWHGARRIDRRSASRTTKTPDLAVSHASSSSEVLPVAGGPEPPVDPREREEALELAS